MKKLVIGLGIVLVFFLFSSIIAFMTMFSSNDDMQVGIGEMIPITFTGEVKGSEINLNAEYDGIVVKGIKGKVSEDGMFSANYANGEGMSEMELPKSPPASLGTFSYMPQFDQNLYSFHLDHNSPQYKLNQSCRTDEKGYRRKGNAYLVALGSYYGSKIGDPYQLSFKQKDGSVKTINVVLGDQKADKDTDAKHQYHRSDKSVVEFIMGGRSNKYAQTVNNDFGTLVSIKKNGGTEIALTGKISNGSISITGSVDGITTFANGTFKEGQINASGYIGDVTDGTMVDGAIVAGDVGQWKGGKLAWPLPGYPNISGAYGTNRGDHIHAGIDIGTHGKSGVPCVAAADGIVVKYVPLASGGARGHYVDVAHGGGLVTRYQHLQPGTGIHVGTKVKAGQKVGIVGGSGFGSSSAYAKHLHFEVLLNYSNGQGQDTNPVPYLR